MIIPNIWGKMFQTTSQLSNDRLRSKEVAQHNADHCNDWTNAAASAGNEACLHQPAHNGGYTGPLSRFSRSMTWLSIKIIRNPWTSLNNLNTNRYSRNRGFDAAKSCRRVNFENRRAAIDCAPNKQWCRIPWTIWMSSGICGIGFRLRGCWT